MALGCLVPVGIGVWLVLPIWMPRSVQQSHIDANVPPVSAFDALLRRDLLAWAQASGLQASRVDYQLLRQAPTQSGVALPKYYAWLKLIGDAAPVQQGAARIAAFDQQRFEVTTFLSAAQIQLQPDAVGNSFPAALLPDILRLAAAAP